MRKALQGLRLAAIFCSLGLCPAGTAVAFPLPHLSQETDPSSGAPEKPRLLAPSLRGLDYLREGQRIKVEGKRFRDGKLIADRVEMAEPADEFELEGIVSNLDRQGRRLQIGPFEVKLTESTEIENSKKEKRSPADLRDGVRIKVKSENYIGRALAARKVRIYEQATDRDFELEGEIDKLEPGKSRLAVSSIQVLVTSKTRYRGIPLPASFGQDQGSQSGRGIRREDDEPDFAAFRIGPAFLGGRVGFAYESSRNFDLAAKRNDENDWLIPSARLELSVPVGEYHELYTKLQVNRGWNVSDSPVRNTLGGLELKEAFFHLGRLFHPALGLQIGRQRFRDKREWVYDDQLDAVRLHIKRSDLKIEVAAARRMFGVTGSRSDQFYLISRAEQRFSGRRYLSAYFIKRNDLTGRDEDPVWFGLQSRGRLTRDLSYWVELSRMMGRKRSFRLRGYGYDVGGSYRLPLPLEPTVAAGYAFGSGDDSSKDRTDASFRQTRLNDNSYRNNGLRRFKYYGLLFDPELSNLKVRTFDLGLRPSRNWSFNLVYHDYRQVVASRELSDAEINARPNGRDPRLGHEWNFVFALRHMDKIDISLFGGCFFPGPAFGGTRARAFLVRPVVLFYF